LLAMSNTPIEDGLLIFADSGVDVAFLVPTPTGYNKSIMDATSPVRNLLKNAGIHDFDAQRQGPDHKVFVTTYLVGPNEQRKTKTSLYRPITKDGDPRIWIYGLQKYCSPCDLLALVASDSNIYVFNLSRDDVRASFSNGGTCSRVITKIANKKNSVANELLERLRVIHRCGFIRSITPGDPGVGDTLEHELGISRNNSKSPDYKGIELKTTRLTRNGRRRARTRSNLFSRVPDGGMTYRQIVDAYGKQQVPRNSKDGIPRFQLYETFSCLRVNGYDLTLDVEYDSSRLSMMHQREDGSLEYVSSWSFKGLEDALMLKHRETFWIEAVSENRGGVEYFRYDKVRHTKSPNASLMAPLFETGKITLDLAAHYKPDGTYRDHGVLFKMQPSDLELLLGKAIEYTL